MQVGRDPASRIKCVLTFVLGATGFLVACVELGKAGEGGTLVRKIDDSLEKSAEASTNFLVATVCPMPFHCPDWCTTAGKGTTCDPKTSTDKCYCKCAEDTSVLDWKFAKNNAGDDICSFIEEATTDPDTPPTMHTVEINKPKTVTVTEWDGFASTNENCMQVNWDMKEIYTSMDNFIACSFHSDLSTDPGREPYPDALLDAKVAIQFHKNPNGPWPLHSYEKKWVDADTGVVNAGQAWRHVPAWHFIAYEIELEMFSDKGTHFWNHKPHPRYEHMMHDSRIGLAENTSAFWDNPPAFGMAYTYQEFMPITEYKNENLYSARRALGVAGGIAFLLSLLSMVVFTCATSIFSLDTSEVDSKAANYEYTYNTAAGGGSSAPPQPEPQAAAGGGGYGSIA